MLNFVPELIQQQLSNQNIFCKFGVDKLHLTFTNILFTFTVLEDCKFLIKNLTHGSKHRKVISTFTWIRPNKIKL
jgi:hypothetical protein